MENLKFILDDKIFHIPSNFIRLNDISQDIYVSLMNEHQYVIQSIISPETMQSFINYLTKNELPNITASNKIEYYQLSKEFNIMGNLLSSYQDTIESYLHNINILKDQSIKDKSRFEEIITSFLDDYLQSCGEQLLYAPIQSLYRIFNNKNRQLTKQNLCYDLIKRHFERTNNSSIFILLPLLNGENLNEQNIKDSIKFRNSRLGMMPNIELSYYLKKEEEMKVTIESLNRKIKKIEDEKKEEIQNLTEKIKELQFYQRDYYEYKFFIPYGKQWTKGNNSNQFTLIDNKQKFTVTASSSCEGHLVFNLFDGKKEIENGTKWASCKNPPPPQYITIEFAIPVSANVLSMSSRNNWNDQAPTSFNILASNDNVNFILLKKYAGVTWLVNERSQFLFKNEKKYSVYKIEFLSSKSPYHYYGLAMLNLGYVVE